MELLENNLDYGDKENTDDKTFPPRRRTRQTLIKWEVKGHSFYFLDTNKLTLHITKRMKV